LVALELSSLNNWVVLLYQDCVYDLDKQLDSILKSVLNHPRKEVTRVIGQGLTYKTQVRVGNKSFIYSAIELLEHDAELLKKANEYENIDWIIFMFVLTRVFWFKAFI